MQAITARDRDAGIGIGGLKLRPAAVGSIRRARMSSALGERRTKPANMSNGPKVINFVGKCITTGVTAMILAALLAGCVLAATVGFAPAAAAKGEEDGVVCTGTQLAAGSCHPRAMQSTPIDSVPLGCKPSSQGTVACGRRAVHVGPGKLRTGVSNFSGSTHTPVAAPTSHTGATPRARR